VPRLVLAEPLIDVGLETTATRISDPYQSASYGGVGLQVAYAPSPSWTLGVAQRFMKRLDEDGDVRAQRPFLRARFLPNPTAGYGLVLEAAVPIVDGAILFDRLDPDAAVDGFAIARGDGTFQPHFSLGYGLQYENPDSYCWGALHAAHTARAKLGAIIRAGAFTMQPQGEARVIVLASVTNATALFGSLNVAFEVTSGWSITASAEHAVVHDALSPDLSGTTVGVGVVHHLGSEPLLPHKVITSLSRLRIPIAHCS